MIVNHGKAPAGYTDQQGQWHPYMGGSMSWHIAPTGTAGLRGKGPGVAGAVGAFGLLAFMVGAWSIWMVATYPPRRRRRI